MTLCAWTSIQPVVSGVQLLCLIYIADIVCMNSNPVCESHVQLFCVISIADIACMNSYAESEPYAALLLDFYCSYCLHELLSRKWVMSSFSAWCPLLTLPAHIACMGFYSACEWLCSSSAWCLLLTLPAWGPIQPVSGCAAPLFDLYCSHCLHGVPSRKWVAVQLLCLISIAHIACMGSHPACELLCSFSVWCPLLILPAWTPTQNVSCCAAPAWISLLTLLAWTPIQLVSHVQLLLDFYYWHCLHELPSSQWVFVKLLCLISITDITCTQSHLDSELSTSTQVVLCLIFIAYVYCLVCSYFNVLSSPYSISTYTFYRHLTFTMSLLLNSM